MTGSRVLIRGGPLDGMLRRVHELTHESIVLSPTTGSVAFVYSWSGKFVAGPRGFDNSWIDDVDRIRLERHRP